MNTPPAFRALYWLLPLALFACSEKAVAPDPVTADVTGTPAINEAAIPPPGAESPPALTTPGPIPLRFRAVWAIDPADCTREPGLTRIAIAPGAVRFYEGRSEVVSAQEFPDGDFGMEVDHMSEGDTTRETQRLKLDAGAGTLAYQRRGETFHYTRCA